MKSGHGGKKEEETFQKSKSLLNSTDILIHYDPEKPMIIACDASPYGLGAVLSHIMPDKSERPIMFTSRTLTNAERNYSQIGKGALAIIFAVKKFHQYIYGQTASIQMDHEPLLGLLAEYKSIPSMAAARIQRWAIILSAYNYKLCYCSGNENNADCMSRLHFDNESYEKYSVIENNVFLTELIHATVTAKEVALYTKCDSVLSKVISYIN